MKTYTITAITKANRTEYFHAVTVEAESVKEAKEKTSAIIRATLDRHAFRIANATAPASIEHAQWIADRFNTTIDTVMQAASRPEGVDAYDFNPAETIAEPEAIAEPEQATEPTEATKNAARWADLAEQAAQQVAEAATICDADAYDNRAAMYAAAAIDEAARYDADDATDAETARAISAAAQARENLISRVKRGMTDADAEAVDSSDYAAALTNEAFAKAGTNPAEARAEAERAARIAAAAVVDAYAAAEAISPADVTPEQSAAAYAVAAVEIIPEAARPAGYATATEEQRETIAAMVEAIAERTHAAEAIEDAREAWAGPDYYRIGYSDGGMDATSDGAIWYETAADLARDLRSAYESATDTHLPYAERIEAEATEYDPAAV